MKKHTEKTTVVESSTPTSGTKVTKVTKSAKSENTVKTAGAKTAEGTKLIAAPVEGTSVETTPKPEKRVKRSLRPSGVAIRKLGLSCKKAGIKLQEHATTAQIEADALQGILAVKKLVGIKRQNGGKLSPLGHMISAQNGQLDEAILKAEKTTNIGEWAKAVAKAGCTTRKSDPEDNAAFMKRLGSHLRFISGDKHSGLINFPKRLAKVGQEKNADAIMSYLTPLNTLFQDHLSAGKF